MGKLIYVREDRRLPAELKRQARSIRDAQRPTGTERDQTMSQMRDQVAELFARRSFSTEPANLSISASTPGQYLAYTRSFSFPPPEGGGRYATLHLDMDFVRTSSAGNINIFMELLQRGSVTYRRTGAVYVGDTASAPTGWGNPGVNEFIQLRVPNADAANMALRFYGNTFIAETVAARMQNLIATLTYGARI